MKLAARSTAGVRFVVTFAEREGPLVAGVLFSGQCARPPRLGAGVAGPGVAGPGVAAGSALARRGERLATAGRPDTARILG
jgi:hypothetical protein